MNIVYVSNDKYVPHLAASMCSVMENNSSPLHFYVISTGISKENADLLREMCESYEKSITILQLEDIKERIGSSESRNSFLRKFDISILGRFFLGEILPEEVDKALYLDCDTICTNDLAKLYNMLPDDYHICAAVMEPTIYKETRKLLMLDNSQPYYNSGVLLIDMNRWRERNIDSKLQSYFTTINEGSTFADQDAINGLLRDKILSIPPKYNFFTNYYYWNYDSLVSLGETYGAISKDEFESAKAAPVIIHFAGDERPWIKGSHNPYASEYAKYLALTYWKDAPMEKGKEFFMFGYHLMNLATVVLPDFRIWLSKKYGQHLHKQNGH